jgi:hypothetical protein
MRILTGLCFLAGCCAAVAACTAAPPKGPDATVTTPAVGRPPAAASVQAAFSSEAFTPYAGIGLDDDGLAPGEGGPDLAAACMTAAGYPSAGAAYDPEISDLGFGTLSSFEFPWGAWGYLGAADVQQYGFRFPPPPRPANPAGAAEQAAAGKCLTIMQDFANAVEAGPLAAIGTLTNDIAADVQQDAAVKAATRAWSACMTKNGYSFAQPQNVSYQESLNMYGGSPGNINFGSPVSASAQQAQLAAAVTDAGCTQSSDLGGIYFAVQASYEKQLVTANQQALAAAVRAYRAAYAKELTKLTALLHTAKAQPFPQAGPPARCRSHAR